jgi:hypothetical protein
LRRYPQTVEIRVPYALRSTLCGHWAQNVERHAERAAISTFCGHADPAPLNARR